MRIPGWLLAPLQRWAGRVREQRLPDYVIGGNADPYMLRWYVIPRNRWFKIYLHEVIRSDDDWALHDHPWVNVSVLVEGYYVEHTIAAGGIHHRRLRRKGDVVMRRAKAAHRLEIPVQQAILGRRTVTLFLTGPVVRHWGFLCPAGWRHWRDFTAGDDGGRIGRGCGEMGFEAARPGGRRPLFDRKNGRAG